MKTGIRVIAVGVFCLSIVGCGTSENGQQQPTDTEEAADQSTTHESSLATGGEPVAEIDTASTESASVKEIDKSEEKEPVVSTLEEFQRVLESFPAGSSIPAILRHCMSTREEIQDTGVDELESLEQQMAEGKLSVQEVGGLFAAYTKLTFPKPVIGSSPLQDIGSVLFLIPQEPARQLVPIIKSSYPSGSWRQKNTFLVMLSGARSREAAEVFAHCIRKEGWPDPTYPRVFWDLDRLHEHADVLYPALLMDAPDEVAFSLSALLAETDRNQVPAESLTPIVPMVRQRLTKAISATQSFQETPNEWLDEEYDSARNMLITFLKIAGRTKDTESVGLLKRALAFRDPLVVIEAVDACLQRDQAVSAEVIEAMAANHLTRSPLFESLNRLNKLEQFPGEWRTWDAFACSEIVGWLNHPAELGTAPAAIEKMKVVQADSDGENYSIYVWRFREEEDSEWLVGISGPYLLRGTPQPVHGHLTFSQFTPWDRATPEGHVNAVIEMFDEYSESSNQ